MYAVRHWSVRNAGRLEWLYNHFFSLLLRRHPHDHHKRAHKAPEKRIRAS